MTVRVRECVSVQASERKTDRGRERGVQWQTEQKHYVIVCADACSVCRLKMLRGELIYCFNNL